MGDSAGHVFGLGWVKVRCTGLRGPVPRLLPWECAGAQRGGCQEEPVGPISREQFLVRSPRLLGMCATVIQEHVVQLL